MRCVVAGFATISLTGCTWLDEYKVPVDKAAIIAEQTAIVLKAADINSDGYIQGYTEWLLFIAGVTDAAARADMEN